MKLRVVTNRYFSSIAEFSFVKEIGVGCFGSVKLALHLQTNKCYAVKVVRDKVVHSVTGNICMQFTLFRLNIIETLAWKH